MTQVRELGRRTDGEKSEVDGANCNDRTAHALITLPCAFFSILSPVRAEMENQVILQSCSMELLVNNWNEQ